MESLISICSLSALRLGLGGDTPPKHSAPGKKHLSLRLRGEKRFTVYFNGFDIWGRRKVSETGR